MYGDNIDSEDSDLWAGQVTTRSRLSMVDPQMVEWQGNLKAIVELDGTSYDAVLTQEMIYWTPIGHERKKRGSLSRRGSRSVIDSQTSTSGKDRVLTKDILGVSLRRAKHAVHKDRQGVCIGFIVYAASIDEDDVTYKVAELTFGHPSEQICRKWCQHIMLILKQFTERPTALKVFMHPFSGRKMSRHIYNTKVLPIFEAAGVTQDIVEIHEEGCNLEDEMDKLDFSNYDSIVCVGGDGTVGRLTTALINKANRLKVGGNRNQSALRPSPVPIGIIPTGTVNQVAYSVMGTEDIITAMVHILLGNRQSADIFSVYGDDKLVCWSYFAHYGFFASVLDQTFNYTLLGEAKVEASVMAVVRRFRCRFDCTLQYTVPENEAGNVTDTWPCRQGCQKCSDIPAGRQIGRRYRHPDEVRSFNEAESSSESCASVEQEDTPESGSRQKISGSFMSASIMSIPGLSPLSPLGMSKYTHLSDGYMDVILVGSRTRKEFIRYLKRTGNTKNQLLLPQIKTIRCKEIQFRFATSYPQDVQGEHEADDNSMSDSNQNIPTQGGVLNPINVDSSDDEEQDQDHQHEQIRSNESTPTRQKKRLSLKPTSLLGTSRTSSELVERRSHGKRAPKWNINNRIKYGSDLSFRVHSNLIEIHGQGVSARYNPGERKMPCLALIT